MIARLTGLLDHSAEGSVIINVGGVGYLVFCSTRTLELLLAEREMVSVYIETHVREDHIHLYGFIDQLEQEWFKLLTTVQGVGAKVALAILSVVAPETLAQTVAAADKAVISQAPGVGPKLATRIISELTNKIGVLDISIGPFDSGIGLKADLIKGPMPIKRRRMQFPLWLIWAMGVARHIRLLSRLCRDSGIQQLWKC